MGLKHRGIAGCEGRGLVSVFGIPAGHQDLGLQLQPFYSLDINVPLSGVIPQIHAGRKGRVITNKAPLPGEIQGGLSDKGWNHGRLSEGAPILPIHRVAGP